MPQASTLSVVVPSTAPSPHREEASPVSPRSTRLGLQERSRSANLLHRIRKNEDSPVAPIQTSQAPTNEPERAIIRSPTFPSVSLPKSPNFSIKHTREPSRSLLSNSKASKSSGRIQPTENSIRQVSEGHSEGDRKSSKVYPSGRVYGSSPDLSPSAGAFDENVDPAIRHRRPTEATIRTGGLQHSNDSNSDVSKKAKPRFAHLLNRTRSIKVEEPPRKIRPSAPSRLLTPDDIIHKGSSVESSGLKTAPLQHEKDRSFRDMMSSTIRNRSADRRGGTDSEEESIASSNKKEPFSMSSSLKDGSGAAFLSNIKSSSSKAADGIGKAGKAGKGFFGKLTRSGSSNEKENVADELYVCTVINLPLVEQTRRTRISKRLEHSRDKTEFWMPALPYRCIDYLNLKGSEVEGLYRVPGSGQRVKEYQRRFDSELDIDLFDEESLYDINIIGSMFKAWLRELPDEIFPKSTQAKIFEICHGSTETPQMLKDELSKLPPYNYYLLFAITCHISLLHQHSEQNKMDFRNLCICFQPCIKIDAFCFQFLVCDWKNCWQGCWTEKEALAEEYRILDGHSESPSPGDHSEAHNDERALSSSGSSKLSGTAKQTPDRSRPHQQERPQPEKVQQERHHHEKHQPETKQERHQPEKKKEKHQPERKQEKHQSERKQESQQPERKQERLQPERKQERLQPERKQERHQQERKQKERGVVKSRAEITPSPRKDDSKKSDSQLPELLPVRPLSPIGI
ncbi:MAG: hypothetical protein M1819_003616 [Sarea resinae]|nr:MAG: hypothetical protein M1819_003616 [Sarea resinae]